MKHSLPFLLLAIACSLGPEPVDATTPNLFIELASEPTFDGTDIIECDGPPEELALLEGICGASIFSGSTTTVRGGWGRYTRIGHLELYVMGDPDDLSSLEFAAYASPIEAREAARGGLVHPTFADHGVCGASFEATATLLWRDTTLYIPWYAAVPC